MHGFFVCLFVAVVFFVVVFFFFFFFFWGGGGGTLRMYECTHSGPPQKLTSSTVTCTEVNIIK